MYLPESGGDELKHDQESNILGQWPAVMAGTFLNEIFDHECQGPCQLWRKMKILNLTPHPRTSVFINKFSVYDN